MAEGQVYVEVDASVVNGGIAPMAIVSGNPTPVDGSSVVVVWIRWRYDSGTGEGGYTGTGWYFNDEYNNIAKHYGTEYDFKQWLVGSNPPDLGDVLDDWPAANKANFLNKHLDKLEAGGCLYFTAN